MAPVQTKTVTISFEVPCDVDLPSEDLLRMKDLLLDALHDRAKRVTYVPQKQRLVDALLTES